MAISNVFWMLRASLLALIETPAVVLIFLLAPGNLVIPRLLKPRRAAVVVLPPLL